MEKKNVKKKPNKKSLASSDGSREREKNRNISLCLSDTPTTEPNNNQKRRELTRKGTSE